MDTTQVNEQLKQALDEISGLRSLSYSNGEYNGWKSKVQRILETAYGQNSYQARRFTEAPGKSFVVHTELGLNQEYARQLDCYQGVLRSMLGLPDY